MHAHNNNEIKKNTFIMAAFFAGMIFSLARAEFETALISGFFIIIFFVISAIQKLPERSGTIIADSVE